jgi:hypothetical protein
MLEPSQVPWLALLAVVYAVYRARFARLPLHMDTAYYVTNHAIATRRYQPFRSWNAFFSGGSRLLPELVHTQLFLRLGAAGYARGFRALYTCLSLVASIATGAVASRLIPGPTMFWVATLACAALLADAQYGAYFESAEAFQVGLDATAMALIVGGVSEHSTPRILTGVLMLWSGVVLVKVTAAVPVVLVSAALSWLDSSLLPRLLLYAAASAVAAVMLARASGRGIGALLGYMRRHEAYVRRNYRNPLVLLTVKVGFACVLLVHNPLLPFLGVLGALSLCDALPAHDPSLVYAAYALGALIAMLQQGNRVWYYLLPLLPPLAVLVALAFAWGSRQLGATPALLLLAAAVVLSIARNLWHARGADCAESNRRVFSVYNRRAGAFGDEFARGNSAVEQACEQLRERVRGATVLVVGRYNQASVLLEAGYDTPLASVCELAEAVAGDLRKWLPEREAAEMPAFLVDTSDELAARAVQLRWMSEYQLEQEEGPVRLYARRAKLAP